MKNHPRAAIAPRAPSPPACVEASPCKRPSIFERLSGAHTEQAGVESRLRDFVNRLAGIPQEGGDGIAPSFEPNGLVEATHSALDSIAESHGRCHGLLRQLEDLLP